MVKPYGRDFFAQNAKTVARDLLGATLLHQTEKGLVGGIIVETEAYTGIDDLASHGRAGKTPRNLPMWEAPGHAYTYLIYGQYWLLNVVCEPPDAVAAVLIRAIEPTQGLDIIAQNRAGKPRPQWTNGPGKLTLALGVDEAHNRVDMTTAISRLWLQPGRIYPDNAIKTGPRIGLGKHVPEPWFSMRWRWWVAGHSDVSRA